MAESDRRAIVALALGIVGLFTAGVLGLGSMVGLVLALSALARPSPKDKDVAWAALFANIFALLTIPPLTGAVLAYRSASGSDARIDSRAPLSEPAPAVEPEATPAAAPPPPPKSVDGGPGSASRPVPIPGQIAEPRKTHHVNPAYPEAARKRGVQGVVILECTISPTGEVVDVKVLRSIPELDQAAKEAVEQWRYAPTLVNGVPVPVTMTVTVNFELG